MEKSRKADAQSRVVVVKKCLTFAAFFVAFFLCSCTQKTVFSDGKSSYTIVISPEAPETEQLAAIELQQWINEVGGVMLPIGDLDSGKPGKRFVVGYNAITEELVKGAEKPEDGDDALTYCNVGGDVLLWGGSTRGTLYAVYSLLERELGCRWYTSRVSVAPPRTKWAFSSLYNHEKPGLRMRNDNYADAMEPRFSGRLRNNCIPLPSVNGEGTIVGSAVRYWGCHTFGYFVPVQKYFDTHPEYFSLIDGKRTNDHTQLCLTNPDVLRLCIEGVSEVMRNSPDNLVYSISQNDWFNACQCTECQAIVDKYGGQQSGIMLWFVNQVADAIKDEFPDKYIGTFAYQYTRTPPTGITPRENVVVRLCSIETCLLHDYDECPENVRFLDDLRQWSSIAPNLYIWDYVCTFSNYLLPLPNFKILASHLRDLRDNKAIGVMEEGDYQARGAELDELRTYVLAKLMWNPDSDTDSLILDFTEGFYGPAGKYIRQYLDYEHEALRREDIHQNCFPNPNSAMYTDDFIVEACKIFQEAEAAVADNTELLERVERAELSIDFLWLARDPKAAAEAGVLERFKRVMNREGFTRIKEWGPAQTAAFIEDIENKLKE